MGFLDTVGKFMPSVLSGGGTLLDAYGKYKAGQDAREVYKYNREFAKFNEKYIDEQADIQLAQLERDVSKVISRQRAIQGRSGTVTDVGSNLQSIINTEDEAAIDAAVIRRTAEARKEVERKRARLADKQGRGDCRGRFFRRRGNAFDRIKQVGLAIAKPFIASSAGTISTTDETWGMIWHY